MPVTVPRRTSTLSWRRSTSRIGGAISPWDRMPVATWYSSGWNRWCVVFATIVTSTSLFLSALVPNNPPKPEPITTTWWRWGFFWTASVADIGKNRSFWGDSWTYWENTPACTQSSRYCAVLPNRVGHLRHTLFLSGQLDTTKWSRFQPPLLG